jgi:type III pantothenate kinase
MILCDIGNSTFHFLQDGRHTKIGLEESFSKLNIDEVIYFISVNDKAQKKLLDAFPNSINIKNKFIFNTSYSKEMGIDRIACCLNQENKIIVDVGSAITVDIIKEGLHLGGFILPGINALKSIYPKISPMLNFNFDDSIDLDKIPNNTNEAINYSIFNMIILPIQHIKKRYNLDIIFTGENSKFIYKHCENYVYEPELIFNSMKIALGENK